MLAPSWVPQNMLGLDATTLVVVVVDTDPSGSEETVADLAGVELDGGSYSRGTADAEVTRIGDAWILFATDVDTFDLSDSDPRAGVWLATDGATDADRALIHYAPDPGAPDPAYTPTWPSGVYDLPIEAIDSILANHDTRITTLENAPGGGGVPDPSGEDDGDVLTVSSGAAVWAPPTGGGGDLPDPTGSPGYPVVVNDAGDGYELMPAPLMATFESLFDELLRRTGSDYLDQPGYGPGGNVSVAHLTVDTPFEIYDVNASERVAVMTLVLTQGVTGGAITVDSGLTIHWVGGSPPAWSSSAGETDVVRFTWLGDGSWLGEVVALGITL